MKSLQILILDDEKGILEDLQEFFEEYDYRIFLAETPSTAFKILHNKQIDIVILDINLPEMNGIEVLKRIKSEWEEIEVIMITGHGDMDTIVQCLRAGATDYISKPLRLMEICSAIERTKKYLALQHKLRKFKQNFYAVSDELQKNIGKRIIGDSPAIQQILKLIAKVAQTDDTSVLITGESGTGKELIARGIHLLSSRKDNYFYAVNCSAITDTLFESELFGHKKGSFTGANENKPGYFEIANGGTIFLDEIGDMNLTLQAKLLRVLDDKLIRRVGSHLEIPVNVRVIAASNQDIKKMIDEKKFRLDLYHRLNSFEIHAPALRNRPQDIPLLIEYFISVIAPKMKKKIKKISPELLRKLSEYHFPGNIRELRNLVERAIILCDSDVLALSHFPSLQKTELLELATNNYDIEKHEIYLIKKVLEISNNNKSKAAELLNITWNSLDRRIKKYNIVV